MREDCMVATRMEPTHIIFLETMPTREERSLGQACAITEPTVLYQAHIHRQDVAHKEFANISQTRLLSGTKMICA